VTSQGQRPEINDHNLFFISLWQGPDYGHSPFLTSNAIADKLKAIDASSRAVFDGLHSQCKSIVSLVERVLVLANKLFCLFKKLFCLFKKLFCLFKKLFGHQLGLDRMFNRLTCQLFSNPKSPTPKLAAYLGIRFWASKNAA
jgi:hypothetical protein